MLRAYFIAVAIFVFGLGLPSPGLKALETGEPFATDLRKPWSGDYDGMLARRKIRVLIPYSKTFFFLDSGVRRGLAVELLREFEKAVNSDVKAKKQRPKIFLIPTRRDRLIPDLLEGRGDIVVANLTNTDERREKIDFSAAFQSGVKEILITPKSQQERQGVDNLAGMTIHVRASSSYFQSLRKANAALKKQGKKPIKIIKANEVLEDEDLLEMVNAELVPAIIMDSHKATFWASIFDNIKLHQEASVRDGGEIAWAFRKDSPKLKAKIDAFAKKASSGTRLGNTLLHRYYKDGDWLKKATSENNIKRLNGLAAQFRKYGARYKIDWLILAALAFHESRLDQSVKGPTGALGVMQIKPSTAASSVVNVPNVKDVDANIHAGAKYLRYLADQYFPDKEIDDLNRIMFALASYNAGPNRIARLRERTPNPNVWFDNVEDTVSRSVGLIPVRYVLNIYEYYVAFQNYAEALAKRREALGAAKGAQ